MSFVWMKLCVLAFVATVVFCACPNSWSHYEDKCFFLSRDNETFADSLKLCEVIGRQYGRSASLATVDDAKTQQFLTDLMIKINSIGMYIGLNDLVTEGTFHWVANGKQATYFNWGPTQPNNRGGNENCVAMRVDPVIGFNYSWTDGPCTVPTTYICEMVLYENRRKKFDKVKVRATVANFFQIYIKALKLCEVIGRQYGRSASLATVDDAKTQQFLTDLMIKINSIGMYIGLNDLVTEGTFHWVANGKQATYFNWGPTQPNNRGGNENCVAMRVDPVIGFNYSWTDGPCTVPTTYICEMVFFLSLVQNGLKVFSLIRLPRDPWTHYKDKCFFLSRDNETFADSLKLCEVIGRQYGRSASLATVDDAKTQQFLADLMIKINSIGMYIGLNDLVTEGTFHWVANGKQATYFNWGPTQPNNRGGNENCVAMTVDPVMGFNYSWTDDPCTVPLTYICEMVAADIGNLLG
ncbi:C-type lectin domain family 4 member E [Mytilus galloprovincialis]|uniref:C-type lectin domain family 4 member E n=1 Tax=Mytilus galloprovincialis TaxID=29158 RepID=A0A8B6ENM3_MYTGA|nr:C-type lectin domain family 4 member E [Mytilus galloprovincialis]